MLDDAYHFMKLNGLKGNHNTVLPAQLSKCRDCDLDTEGGISSDATGFNGLTETTNDTPKLLVWSTADEKGIFRLKETWKSRFPTISKLNKESPRFLNDLAHTLASRRSHLSWRSFAVTRPSDDLGALFDRFSPASKSRGSLNLAMMFSGVSLCLYFEITDTKGFLARSPVVCDGAPASQYLPRVPAKYRGCWRVSPDIRMRMDAPWYVK